MTAHDDIRIGTLVPAHERTAEVIGQLLAHGFETFQISFGRTVGSFDVATTPTLSVPTTCRGG